MNKPLKVLIVEDSEDDAKLALRALRGGSFDPTYRRVQTAAELKTALAEGGWDALISDFAMPGFTGIDALRIFRATGIDIPFILISGTIGEETAVDAMKSGASDYVMKANLARLAPALERELKETQMRAAHRRDQEALAVSELRFRQIAENIRDVFFLREAGSNRILYVSPAYEQIWGRSCESLYANPESWSEAIHPDDRASAYEKSKAGIATGAYQVEYRIVRPDGSIRWIDTRGFPVRDDAGKTVRIAGVAKDITEHKQDDQKFKDLLEAAPDAMVIVNHDSEIVLVNARAVDLFGWRRENLLGQKIDILVPERFRGKHPANRSGYFAQPRARAMDTGAELFGLRKDGTEFPVDISLSPLETIEGPLVISAIRDTTERKRAETALRESERRYRTLFESMDEGFCVVEMLNDRDGKAVDYRFVEINPAFEKLTGLYQALGKTIRQMDPNHNAQWFDIYGKVARTGKAIRFENRADAMHRIYDVFAFRIGGDGSQSVGILFSDITERKGAEEDREHRKVELEESQRVARIGSWVWTPATGVITWSDGMNHILARDRALPAPTFEGLPLFYTPESWQRLGVVIATAIETGAPYDLELEMIRADGTTCWTTTRGEVIRGADGAVVKLRGTVHDITDRKLAESRVAYLSRVHAVLSGINALIVRVRDRNELFKEACRIAVEKGGFRMALIGIVDRSAMKIVPVASEGVDEEFATAIKEFLSSSEGTPEGKNMVARAIKEKTAVVSNDLQSNPEIVFRKQYAESGIHSAAFLPLIVADEAVGTLALFASEIGFFQEEEMALLSELAGDIAFAIDHLDKQARLDYLAYYDVLTGLANRKLFLDRVTQYMRSAVSGGHKLALFVIDLERFKNINDSLGQPAGDALLRQVAEWLTLSTGDVNLVARIGADHFATVLPEVKQGGDGARLVEEMIKAFMDHPFRLNDAVFRIAVKVGVAVFPDDGADADSLFSNAEAALKKAKAIGERYLFYTQTMTELVAGKLTLENQLRRALDNEEFVLHYQPKVNLASGRVTSAEALIRWNDPRTGLVPPGRFIPILEETGLIYDVGRWALKKAIEDYLRWRRAGLPAVRIAVNVSPLQLRNRGFIAEIEQVIGIDTSAVAGLELEITESLIMADIKLSIASLQVIRALGVTIAIDDFGTGFSSLSYLAKLPVDTLKIDRSFVIDMTAGPEGLGLVSTIINLAHALKLKVVAEGVETEEQSRLLRLLACDEMQGFLFSKPVPAEIFEAKFLGSAAGTGGIPLASSLVGSDQLAK